MAERNRFIQKLLTMLSLFFYRVTLTMPLPMARCFGVFLAHLAYYVLPRMRRVCLSNLDIAYGDSLSKGEKRKILKESVCNLGLVMAEFSRIPAVVTDGNGKLFRVEGEENIDHSRGGIFMGAHLGNWEWLAPAGGAIGLKVVIIVRGFDDPRLDGMVDDVRRSENVETIRRDAATGPLISRLKAGWYVGILADQNPRRNAVPVTFFGASAWATVGPALIAQRTKVPVYPVSMVRDSQGVYTLHFYPALDFSNTGDLQQDLVINTQRCQDAIEVMVRRDPGQWLWFHRRWRKRGRLEQEWKERATRKRNTSAVAGGGLDAEARTS